MPYELIRLVLTTINMFLYVRLLKKKYQNKDVRLFKSNKG